MTWRLYKHNKESDKTEKVPVWMAEMMDATRAAKRVASRAVGSVELHKKGGQKSDRGMKE